MEEDNLRVKVDLPFFKLEMVSKANPALIKEIRLLMKEINYQDFSKEGLPFELDYSISEEFKNSELNNFIRRAFTVSEDFIYKKATLTLILDVNRKKVATSIDKNELEKSLDNLFFQTDTKKIDFLAVHVIGNVSKEMLNLIIDQIEKRVPHSEIKATSTSKKMLGKIVIEVLFFGQFPYQYDEPFFE